MTTQDTIAAFPRRVLVDLSHLHCETPFGIVDPGEPGYHPLYVPADRFTVEALNKMVAQMNDTREATRAEMAAALAGSMFGWHVPAADPAHYDDTGAPRR